LDINIPDTFRITNPLWTRKIEERTTWEEVYYSCIIDGNDLDISSYPLCIVGETLNLRKKKYKYDGTISNYEEIYHNGCMECYMHSHSLYDLINDLHNDDANDVELECMLQVYIKHIEDVHPNYIKNAKRRNK